MPPKPQFPASFETRVAVAAKTVKHALKHLEGVPLVVDYRDSLRAFLLAGERQYRAWQGVPIDYRSSLPLPEVTTTRKRFAMAKMEALEAYGLLYDLCTDHKAMCPLLSLNDLTEFICGAALAEWQVNDEG